jgi:hypothetical protein
LALLKLKLYLKEEISIEERKKRKRKSYLSFAPQSLEVVISGKVCQRFAHCHLLHEIRVLNQHLEIKLRFSRFLLDTDFVASAQSSIDQGVFSELPEIKLNNNKN